MSRRTALNVASVPTLGLLVACCVALGAAWGTPFKPYLYGGAWYEVPGRALALIASPPRSSRARLWGGGVLAAGGLAGITAAGALGFALVTNRGTRAQLRPHLGGATPEPVRARSKLHGAADWLSERDMLDAVLPRHPDHGGIVFGVAARADLHPERNGGAAPLLRDLCLEDAVHGQVNFGSGGGKTSSITVTNLDPDDGWRGNVLVNDPSSQAGAMCAAMREEIGQRVLYLGPPRRADEPAGPSRVGMDLFVGIDPSSNTFEQDVCDAADSLGREFDPASAGGENGMFKVQGRALQTCLLADLLADPATPRAERTPRGLIRRVMQPENLLRGRLETIHAESPSEMARLIAGDLMKLHPKTFGGCKAEATADLKWLQISAYADLVSSTTLGSLRADDFVRKDMCIFLQLGIKTMESTPQIGRAILNALLGAVYRVNGATKRRYLLLNDEARLFGKLSALSIAMSQGRKYGITVISMWHDPAQMEGLLGKDEARTWRANSAWEAYSAMGSETAKVLSERLGTYTVLAPSEGHSTSTQSNASGGRSRGRNDGVTLQARRLATAEEIEFGMRSDEQIVFWQGAKAPVRCLKAYYWRRRDMAARVGRDTYRIAAE